MVFALDVAAPELPHAPEARVGVLAAAVVGFVVAATLSGLAWDVLRMRPNKQDRPRSLPGWAVGMLVSSYALLIPGLMAPLFVARTDFVFFGIVQNVNKYDETMVSLVGRLARDQMYAGAALVTLYAMAIPLLKILLLVLGQSLRRRGLTNVRRARVCIRVVQAISKWACPDMFAYILLMCLMRGLEKPPDLRSNMILELGFTCFSVFCIASTASSLGIRLPELPSEAAERPRAVGGRIARLAAVVAVALLALVFVGAFALGLALPSMSLQMDMSLLYEVRPDLQPMKAVTDSLHLDELLHEKVSVWECIVSLFGWVARGEVNALIALVLYAGFAVLLPVVDMALLVIAAMAGLRPGSQISSSALSLSRKVFKMSMLDVSVMGSLVVVLSLMSLRSKGVIVKIHAGVAALLVAELCHYAAAFIVRRVHRDEPRAEMVSEGKAAQASPRTQESPVNADEGDSV